jgi:hypothetical protein
LTVTSNHSDCLKTSPLIAPLHSAETCQRLGATIRVHVDQERNSSSAVDERRFIEQPYAARDLHADYSVRGSGQYFQSCKNAGTSVDQVERFYARNLPLSKEMAINLQGFGSA